MKGKREGEKRRRGRKRSRGNRRRRKEEQPPGMGGVGALRERMKEGKEALGVKKMNSESQVRRCGRGAERGAQAWGVRLTSSRSETEIRPSTFGDFDPWGRGVRSDSGYPRREAATSRRGEFFFSSPRIFLRGHVVCGCQAASLPRPPTSVVP